MLVGHLISSFVKYLFQFPVFKKKIDLFAFLLLICKNSLHVLFVSPSSRECAHPGPSSSFARVLSHSVMSSSFRLHGL